MHTTRALTNNGRANNRYGVNYGTKALAPI